MPEFSPIDALCSSYLILDSELGEADPYRMYNGQAYHEDTLAREAYEQIATQPELYDLDTLPIDTQRHLMKARKALLEEEGLNLPGILLPCEQNQTDKSTNLHSEIDQPTKISGEWTTSSGKRFSRGNTPIPLQGTDRVSTPRGAFRPRKKEPVESWVK